MLGFLRVLVSACVLGALVWVAVALPLGDHTLWGHVQRIWATEEAQDLVEGAEKSAGPAVERVTRGIKAGVREATRGGAVDAGPMHTPPRP